MGEITINYEQKYKSALEWMRELYPTLQGMVKEDAEHCFPELRESEDERIRKEIVQSIQDNMCVIHKDKCLAWLEKQKEPESVEIKDISIQKMVEEYRYTDEYDEAGNFKGKPVNCMVRAYEKGIRDVLTVIKNEQGEQKPVEQDTEIHDLWVYIREWNDKFGRLPKDEDELAACIDYVMKRQKPTDKIEPKFKVGDWIVYNRDYYSREIMQIYDIRDCRYYFNDNIHFSWSIKECDEKCHLWTIQDAKKGDVLSFNDGHGNDSVELIKSITDKKIEFWFCLTNSNRYEVFDGVVPYINFASREDAIPATKEQRDLLFQKMKEAGYEWDAEKKELKKIEQESAWSEEDERMLGKCIDAASGYYSPEDKQSIKDWLESLKDRVQLQPKQEWSEYDKIQLSEAIQMIEANGTWIRSEDAVKKVSNWLKSLKPNHWKPSEEQIGALNYAYCELFKRGENGEGSNCVHPLMTLIDDLKNFNHDTRK